MTEAFITQAIGVALLDTLSERRLQNSIVIRGHSNKFSQYVFSIIQA